MGKSRPASDPARTTNYCFPFLNRGRQEVHALEKVLGDVQCNLECRVVSRLDFMNRDIPERPVLVKELCLRRRK